MSSVKCQAVNPAECQDKRCPNKITHMVAQQNQLYLMDSLLKTLDSETDFISWDDYYQTLYSSLDDRELLSETIEEIEIQLHTISEEEDIINKSLIQPYYDKGEWEAIPYGTLSKLEALKEHKDALTDVLHNTEVAYYATFHGNVELKEKIRELKNTYPKDREAIHDSLQLFHEAESFHKKQLIAALIMDGKKKQYGKEINFSSQLKKTPSGEGKETVQEWLKGETVLNDDETVKHDVFLHKRILGFRNYVDLEGLDYDGEWFIVVKDGEGQRMSAKIPEQFPEIFPKVKDLTLFKETLIGKLVVLRRLRKRKLASSVELDMLAEVEYDSKRLSELKQL